MCFCVSNQTILDNVITTAPKILSITLDTKAKIIMIKDKWLDQIKGAEITSLMCKGTWREVESGDRYRPSSLEICSLLGLENFVSLTTCKRLNIFGSCTVLLTLHRIFWHTFLTFQFHVVALSWSVISNYKFLTVCLLPSRKWRYYIVCWAKLSSQNIPLKIGNYLIFSSGDFRWRA